MVLNACGLSLKVAPRSLAAWRVTLPNVGHSWAALHPSHPHAGAEIIVLCVKYGETFTPEVRKTTTGNFEGPNVIWATTGACQL